MLHEVAVGVGQGNLEGAQVAISSLGVGQANRGLASGTGRALVGTNQKIEASLMELVEHQAVLGAIQRSQHRISTRVDDRQDRGSHCVKEHLDLFFGHDLHAVDRGLHVDGVERLLTKLVVLANGRHRGGASLGEVVDADAALLGTSRVGEVHLLNVLVSG